MEHDIRSLALGHRFFNSRQQRGTDILAAIFFYYGDPSDDIGMRSVF